ncbi:HU family DNA-binding protein [Coprothermobacter platensis]|uniref:HU family DNA-binding protein n=1 Tax=Coprothermobacter platensis TaxID=108819 RepID=UPI000374208E|nr:HU family DNA-binding protein [Coprothermobacter platensis]
MTKPELVDALAERTGLKKKDAEMFLNGFMDVVTETVKSGEPVVLVGFGKFVLRERKARKGVNPKTRQPIDIPAKKTVVFRPGKELHA